MSGELLAHLAAHSPADAAEARDVARVRRLISWLRAPLDEHADPTHVTGSAIVVAEDTAILLHRHKRLGRWWVHAGGLVATRLGRGQLSVGCPG